jgi:TonB family protein
MAFPQSVPAPVSPPAGSAPVRQVKVAPDEASAFAVQKVPAKYPDAARNAGVQGMVVLRVVIGISGDVKEGTVLSGNPALAQAAIEAVKQWKYKPYVVEGSPAEMETQVTFTFRLQAKTVPSAPPLGMFRDGAYSNEYFGLFYPLSRDWVRETEVMRKKAASEGVYVLLSEVYVPQVASLSEVNSSFTLLAVSQPASDCKNYLEAVAASLPSNRTGQQIGDISQFAVGGHDFYRTNFEYREALRYRSMICKQSKDYLLLWNVGGTTKNAVETAVLTLNTITDLPPKPATEPSQVSVPMPTPKALESSQTVAAQPTRPIKVRVSAGVSGGLLIKKVVPSYPLEARQAHIQGSVVLQAEIDKSGDIVDLEVIDGPLELVVSAVNAVRQWKYRPYLLLGQPVAVETQIVVNYFLTGH